VEKKIISFLLSQKLLRLLEYILKCLSKMPLLRNSKNVNKCFDDTFSDKNVANHFINSQFSICKLRLLHLHRGGSQKFTDCINEEKENLYNSNSLVFFSPDAVPAILERGRGERSPSFSSSEKSKIQYFSLET